MRLAGNHKPVRSVHQRRICIQGFRCHCHNLNLITRDICLRHPQTVFQKEIAEAVSVPVFMSSLLQLPLIRIMHGEKANIGILTASKSALSPRHLEACRVDWDSVTVEGMEGNLEFWETIIEGKRTDFNVPELEREIVGTALRFIETGKLDALLLECTDLAPFARQIQEQSHVPVYDINSLMMLVHSTVRWKI